MDCRHEFQRTAATRIVVGAGVEARLPALLRELGARDVFVLHDGALAAVAQRVAMALGARRLALPAGERVKDLRHVADVAQWLRDHGADRSATLLGLGGGAATDVAGFVAAILLRGVRFVACATTTLAVCDAAIGGKNGIDFDGRKNELGTIRQPDLVAADLAWLATLPDAQFREGFVEAAKMAAVLDAGQFAQLEREAAALRARAATATAAAVDASIAMKMAVVLADETERDRRRWLNFGHTIGHALESLAAGSLRHGESVAIGMLAECRAARVDAALTARLTALLQALGAPTVFPPAQRDAEALWALARLDKKATTEQVPMVVPHELGRGGVVALTREALAHAIA